MAFWRRIPKGTYVRDTPSWFAHQRGRCSIQGGSLSNEDTLAYGLYNNSTQGVYLHVIGMFIDFLGEGVPPIFGKFIGGVPDTTNIDVPAVISPTAPIYSNDPMPPGMGVFGGDANASFADSFVFHQQLNGQFVYYTGEIAVIAPNTTWQIYYGEGGETQALMFEWYWMED
jgi:hypothetical protein